LAESAWQDEISRKQPRETLTSAGVNTESLPEGDNPLPGTGNTTLDHDEVVLDDTVMRPSTERVDGLLGDVSLSGTG
jgi:hypothetical protein